MELSQTIGVRPPLERGRLPADLSAWMDKRALVGVVLNNVRAVRPEELQAVASVNAGSAFQPRLLLALLTYCYSVGIWDSQDIEQVLHHDVSFRFLCGNEYPDWHMLRRFRRHNREILMRCLSDTCRTVWDFTHGCGISISTMTRASDRCGHQATNGLEPDRTWAEEAEHRLEQAILFDSEALHD